jgi:hypothetical protein
VHKYNSGSSPLSQMDFNLNITEWRKNDASSVQKSTPLFSCPLYQFLCNELRTLRILTGKGRNGVDIIRLDKREKIIIIVIICNASRYISWVSCSLNLKVGQYN